MGTIDFAFLHKFTKGDEAKIKRYISMYLQHSTELVAKMRAALESNEPKSLAIHAHTLKPQAEMMGVVGLKEKLERIEDLAKNEEFRELPALLDRVADLNAKAKNELSAHL